MTSFKVAPQKVILPLLVLLFVIFGLPKAGLAWEICGNPFGIKETWYGHYDSNNVMLPCSTFQKTDSLYFYNKCNLTGGDWTNYPKMVDFEKFSNSTGGTHLGYTNDWKDVIYPPYGKDYIYYATTPETGDSDYCRPIVQSLPNTFSNSSDENPCFCMSNEEPGLTTPECSGYTYTDWSVCDESGYQDRSIITTIPEECSGGSVPELLRECVPINNATSSIDLDFDNYIAQRSWVNLTGDCSPEETTKLVYVYQSNTTALPSDNYNIVGIQQGISSDYFNVYAEPCDETGSWSRIVFLEKGQNYFTTYTRQQDFGTTWNSTSHSNTVNILYDYNFDFSLVSPVGVDSFRFGHQYRVFNGKTLYGVDDLFLVGHFNNGSLIDEEASFFVDELDPDDLSYYPIRSDIISGILNDEYKTACHNYPSGCLYALKMDEEELNDDGSAGERLYSISFYSNNNKNNLFARYIFKINWSINSGDPDIVWGLPIDSSWSTSTNPYLPPEQSDDTLSQALDRLYTIYSVDNLCGRFVVDGNVLENIVKFIPIRFCRLSHYFLMPRRSTLERLIGIGDVFLDSFPWSVPFIITNSMMDSLERAKIAEESRFSIPIPFYYNNATTTIDVSDPVYDTINKIGSTKLYWVFNGLTFREVSGVLLTFGVIIYSGVLIVRLVKGKSGSDE